jgi:hypothetical protein
VSEAVHEREGVLQAELREERARRAAAERQLRDEVSVRLGLPEGEFRDQRGATMRLPGMDDESELDLREFTRTSVFGDRDD